MIDNYEIDEHSGTIHQIKRSPYPYNQEYNNIYNTEKYTRNSILLSALRCAFVRLSIPEKITHVLDFGYGNGDFLRVAMMTFEQCNGYDISDYTPDGINRVKNIWERYDVVTFWDALEHIPDYSFIKDLNTKYIALSMPFCHYKELGDNWFKNWKHLKPDEHLHHFTPDSLCIEMVTKFGYDPVIINSDVEDIIRTPEGKLQNIFCSLYKKR